MLDTTLRNGQFPRALARALRRDLGVYPVVAVMGARQVGKSTLCREIAAERGFGWCTLDDGDVRREANEDPEGLLGRLGGAGVVIDEVQRVPALMLALKSVVDRDGRPGRYLLSGSNQPRVRAAMGDSLLGRAAYRTLRPLTLSELRFSDDHAGWSFLFAGDDRAVVGELERRAESSGVLDWYDMVATGGFPRVVAARAEDRARLLDDYVAVFASRDIREIAGVESSDRFESFLRLVGARTGQVLNVAGMATDLGAPVSTVRRWMGALERSYLVELIPAYSRNAGHRVTKAPKLVMVDSALALAAAREADPTGFHLETFVACDLAVWRDGAPGRGVYHWRRSTGEEVDFVLEERGVLLPIEVKAAAGVTARDARHLRAFREAYRSVRRGLVLSTDPRIRVLPGGDIAAPWWAVV